MGGRETDVVLLDENGIRSDGRKVNETRKVTIKVGVLKNADGSAYIEFGGNKILAGVFGPRDVHPKHMSNPDTGILRVRYHMEPFSVTERKNPARGAWPATDTRGRSHREIPAARSSSGHRHHAHRASLPWPAAR